MNISTKQEQAKRIKRDYENLTKFSSHEYAIAWVATKLHISADEVKQIIDEVTA